MAARPYEALEVGEAKDCGAHTFTEAGIVGFAERFDPQPIHVDPDAAAASDAVDGVVASGWHTTCVCMRQFVDAYLAEVASRLAVGVDELRWFRPVRPGDTLSVDASVVDKEPWDGERGLVSFEVVGAVDGETATSRVDHLLVDRDG